MATRGQQERVRVGALTCLLLLGRNSPRVLKREGGCELLGMPRGVQIFTSQEPLPLFVKS